MAGYYDIHTHILPGMDDGARTKEETVQMLKLAYEEGVRHIIATPHFTPGEKNPSRETLEKALEFTQEEARKIDPSMTVALGNEILHDAGALSALKKGEALTLGGTRYILVEFMPSDSYNKIYSAMREYVMNGYIPIMAHMERYESLVKAYDSLKELSELGVYFQMNTESIIGGLFQRKAAYHRKLVEEGYIQFFGSDCHRGEKRRLPQMESALKYLDKEFMGDKLWESIFSKNPEKMLADEFI